MCFNAQVENNGRTWGQGWAALRLRSPQPMSAEAACASWED